MNNPDRQGPLLFHYRCDACSKRFSLRSRNINSDPYPKDPEIPEKENMTLCVSCRRQQDREVKELFTEIFLDGAS